MRITDVEYLSTNANCSWRSPATRSPAEQAVVTIATDEGAEAPARRRASR